MIKPALTFLKAADKRPFAAGEMEKEGQVLVSFQRELTVKTWRPRPGSCVGLGRATPSSHLCPTGRLCHKAYMCKEISAALVLLLPIKMTKPGQLLVGFIKRKASDLGICVS